MFVNAWNLHLGEQLSNKTEGVMVNSAVATSRQRLPIRSSFLDSVVSDKAVSMMETLDALGFVTM